MRLKERTASAAGDARTDADGPSKTRSRKTRALQPALRNVALLCGDSTGQAVVPEGVRRCTQRAYSALDAASFSRLRLVHLAPVCCPESAVTSSGYLDWYVRLCE